MLEGQDKASKKIKKRFRQAQEAVNLRSKFKLTFLKRNT